MAVLVGDIGLEIRVMRRKEKLHIWEYLIERLKINIEESGVQRRKKLARQIELTRLENCVAGLRRLESRVNGTSQHAREPETPPGFPNGRLPNPWTRARKKVRD